MYLTVRPGVVGSLKGPNHDQLAVLVRAPQVREPAARQDPQARPVLGPHARPDAYAGPVGLLEKRRQCLAHRTVPAGLLDEPEADLGLVHLVRSGSRRAEEPDRSDHEAVGAPDDVPRSPGGI